MVGGLGRGSGGFAVGGGFEDVAVVAFLHEELLEVVLAIEDSIECSIGGVC